MTTRKNPTNDELTQLKRKLDELRALRNRINEVLGETSHRCNCNGYWYWPTYRYPYYYGTVSMSNNLDLASGKTHIQSNTTDSAKIESLISEANQIMEDIGAESR